MVTPTSNHWTINNWFQQALDYDSIKNQVLSGELDFLSPQEKKIFLSFVDKGNILHKAVKDPPFLKRLIEEGADIHSVDENGHSLLTLASYKSGLFLWLLQKGAVVEERNLRFVLEKAVILENRPWIIILDQILETAPLQLYKNLSDSSLFCLLEIAENHTNIKSHLLRLVKEIAIQEPEMGVVIARTLLSKNRSHLKWLLSFALKGLIQDSYLLQIMKDPKIAIHCISDSGFLQLLRQYESDLPAFQTLSAQYRDLRLGLAIEVILNTQTLRNASAILDSLSSILKISDPAIKTSLVTHIQTLQKKEGSTIWHHLLNANLIPQLQDIGFDLNWTDAKGRNFFFTKKAAYPVESSSCNLDQLDINGENALEYHCRYTRNEHCIRSLAKLKLKISDAFPHAQLGRELFPGDLFFQALLSSALLTPEKALSDNLFSNLNLDELNKLFTTIQQIETPDFTPLKNWINLSYTLKMENPPAIFQEQELALLLDPEKASKISKLFGDLGEKEISSEDYHLIPGAPIASLHIALIKKQQETTKPEKSLIPIDELFDDSLSKNDLLQIGLYLFEHPEVMSYLMQTYMKVKKVDFKFGGGTLSNYAQFVDALMSNAKNLTHLSNKTSEERKIFAAFQARISPSFQETLTVKGEVQKLGRTAVILSNGSCDAYKFLKKGENYSYFAQEHSVSRAFGQIADQFKSQFHKPIGVYVVRQLPEVLQEFSPKEPAIVYHYQADPSTFQYLQNLPETQFLEARNHSLHDATKMVHMGLCPDLVALFHNAEQNRGYMILVDLLVKNMRQDLFSFTPAGGAGRLDQVFSKIEYPNIRGSGLTDLRDAIPLEEDFLKKTIKDMHKLKANKSYFFQMYGLSNVLLVDMLLLAYRSQKQDCLHWQNESEVETFGNQLAEGFALVCSTYTNKPYDEYLHFARSSGINWSLAARQIAFWLDTSIDGYPAWVSKGQVPSNIYEKETEVLIDASTAPNFDSIKGFSSNGNQDIGPFNGPLGLTEFEKAMYLLFHPLLLAEPLESKKRKAENS